MAAVMIPSSTYQRLKPRNDLDRVGDVIASDRDQVAVLLLGSHRKLSVLRDPRLHLPTAINASREHTLRHVIALGPLLREIESSSNKVAK